MPDHISSKNPGTGRDRGLDTEKGTSSRASTSAHSTGITRLGSHRPSSRRRASTTSTITPP